jgi:hypothetical protein
MRIRPEPSVTATVMNDGGMVLLAERGGKFYRCNPTAAAIWSALVRYGGRPDLAAAAVAERYDMGLTRVCADLDVLVGELCRAGLVRAEP